jgi:hypothetical protein
MATLLTTNTYYRSSHARKPKVNEYNRYGSWYLKHGASQDTADTRISEARKSALAEYLSCL